MLKRGGSTGSQRQRLGVYVILSRVRQKVAKRLEASWSLLISSRDAMDAWSGDVADSGDGVVWCSDFLLSAVEVEESVGGSSVFVFMLLLVSEEEHCHTDTDMHLVRRCSKENNNVIIRSTTCWDIHYRMIVFPFDLSSSRSCLFRLSDFRGVKAVAATVSRVDLTRLHWRLDRYRCR